MSEPDTEENRSEYRLVVVGAGFGAASLLRYLPANLAAPRDTLLVDRYDEYAYLPLAHEVATGRLGPGGMLSRNADLCSGRATFLRGEALSLAPEARELTVKTPTGETRHISYEYLVVATGAGPAPPPKSIAEDVRPFWSLRDAMGLRSDLSGVWEAATGPSGLATGSETSVAVVGGGATGVELACEMGALFRDLTKGSSLARRPNRPPKVVLFEASGELMSWLDPYFHRTAMRRLAALGVEVRLNSEIGSTDKESVTANGERTPARTKVWTAGLEVGGFALKLPGERDELGRVRVDRYLTLPDRPEVYVIGDTASFRDRRHGILPPTASVAVQQGPFVARDLGRRTGRYGSGKRRPGFEHFDRGYVVSLGPEDAAADALGEKFSGPQAHRLYRSVLLYYLRGRKNRALVASEWGMRRLGRLGF
ncbi:NAD(P)/FAD-dependent oxidoreductase [Rubrobacter indicoceani]|uniref:NAD(P)/FAD-dependent oxidoreductase n=1 Tax=Rubrobacter indicoceani TaxID=2051957 RepID=UPI000E5B787F|nr:FAD-dependent oxidoreductase [Rubrobacter indicoceani]